MLPLEPIYMLGVKLSPMDSRELLDAISALVAAGGRATIASGNAHAFNIACQERWYRDFLNAADFVRIDGEGMRLGARLLGHRIPQRSTWADFGWDLAAHCAARGHALFFFGGQPGVADAAAQRLAARHPELRMAGTQHGYIVLGDDSAEEAALIERINASGADVLVVGLGMPLQEAWLVRVRNRLRAPVVMTAGGAFDFVSGRVRRAPRWLLDRGLEWVYRLWREPRRLWRRYLIGNPVFILRVLRERFRGSPPAPPPRSTAGPAERESECG